MTAPTINMPTILSNRSFTVSWTVTDPDHNYIVTWTNLRTDMMSSVTVPENTNSYMVTGLNGVDNYNVSVAANNSCGMMMSDPITVYGKNVSIYILLYTTVVLDQKDIYISGLLLLHMIILCILGYISLGTLVPNSRD